MSLDRKKLKLKLKLELRLDIWQNNKKKVVKFVCHRLHLFIFNEVMFYVKIRVPQQTQFLARNQIPIF